MYLLFDIGATKTRIAKSLDLENFEPPQVFPTPAGFEEALNKYKQVVDELVDSQKVSAVCVGVPGPLNKDKSKLVNAPNIPGWIGKPLKKELSEITQAAVTLENDVALAALGEAVEGAGAGSDIVAYISIGTGLGGARIVKGQIDLNALGFEPGHQIIDLEKNKSLENYVSGGALEKKYGKKGEEITDPKIWQELTRILAIGINNVIVHWSPQVVVIGGSVAENIPFEMLNEEIKKTIKIFPELPQIKQAELEFGALHGAMKILKELK